MSTPRAIELRPDTPFGGGGQEPPTSAAPPMRNPVPGSAAGVIPRVTGANPAETLQTGRVGPGTVPSGGPPGPNNPAAGVTPSGLSPQDDAEQGVVPVSMSRVSDRAAEIAGQDSPMMRQAALQGRQTAARRGLASSSLAAGAAQEAVIGRAGELARADVSAGLQERSVRVQERGAAVEEGRLDLQGKRLDLDRTLGMGKLSQDERRLVGDLAYQRHDMTYKDARNAIENQRIMLQAELGRANIRLGQARLNLEGQRLNFDERKHLNDVMLTQQRIDNEVETRKLNEWRINNEINRGNRALDIQSMQAATGIVSTAGTNFANELNSILSNPDIKGDDRQRLIDAAKGRHDNIIRTGQGMAAAAGLTILPGF